MRAHTERRTITPEQKAKYIQHRGVACPFCESSSIEAGSFDCQDGCAWQEVNCADCGEVWQDIYHLADIDNEYV